MNVICRTNILPYIPLIPDIANIIINYVGDHCFLPELKINSKTNSYGIFGTYTSGIARRIAEQYNRPTFLFTNDLSVHWLPEMYIHRTLDRINEFVDFMEHVAQNVVVIFDDMFEHNINARLMDFIINSRHHNVVIVMTMRHVNVEARLFYNFDYVFCNDATYLTNISNRMNRPELRHLNDVFCHGRCLAIKYDKSYYVLNNK